MVLNHDMSQQCFFACLLEDDQAFINRTGWVYLQGSSIYLPSDDILVLPPSPWIFASPESHLQPAILMIIWRFFMKIPYEDLKVFRTLINELLIYEDWFT